jgi:hypothetical protein
MLGRSTFLLTFTQGIDDPEEIGQVAQEAKEQADGESGLNGSRAIGKELWVGIDQARPHPDPGFDKTRLSLCRPRNHLTEPMNEARRHLSQAATSQMRPKVIRRAAMPFVRQDETTREGVLERVRSG